MGLDMKLSVSKYISPVNTSKGYSQENGWSKNYHFQRVMEETGYEKLVERETMSGVVVEVPVMYWRKANAIHKWFVDYLAEGVDECQEIECDLEQLGELVSSCKKVLDDNARANSVLPTESGFFFGPTEYDGYYFDDIRYTHDRLSEVIRLMRELGCNYATYRASW
jgi:hypothetical protein